MYDTIPLVSVLIYSLLKTQTSPKAAGFHSL